MDHHEVDEPFVPGFGLAVVAFLPFALAVCAALLFAAALFGVAGLVAWGAWTVACAFPLQTTVAAIIAVAAGGGLQHRVFA